MKNSKLKRKITLDSIPAWAGELTLMHAVGEATVKDVLKKVIEQQEIIKKLQASNTALLEAIEFPADKEKIDLE